jgi:hypothetical protein
MPYDALSFSLPKRLSRRALLCCQRLSLSYQYKPVRFLNILLSSHIV